MRLLQIATGTEANKTLITPVVFRMSAVGQVAETVAGAMLFVTTGRPPQSDYWMYAIQYEVKSHVLPTIRGVVANTGRLVFDVDFWETQADQTGGQQPKRRNTFIHEFTQKQLAGSGPIILGEIDDYLVRAEFGGYPPDGRDPGFRPDATDPMKRTTKDPAQDPLSLLTRPAIADKDGVFRTLPATWRSPA